MTTLSYNDDVRPLLPILIWPSSSRQEWPTLFSEHNLLPRGKIKKTSGDHNDSRSDKRRHGM